MHTNILSATSLIDGIDKGYEFEELYLIDFITACLDYLFIERYLEEYELDSEKYEEINEEDPRDIYFALWLLRRQIGTIRLLLNRNELYSRDFISKELKFFVSMSEQLIMDLEMIEEIIENSY